MGLGHRDYRFMYSLESGGLYLAPSTYVAHFTHEHQRECARTHYFGQQVLVQKDQVVRVGGVSRKLLRNAMAARLEVC